MSAIFIIITCVMFYSKSITSHKMSSNTHLLDHNVDDFVYGFEDKDFIVPCKPVEPNVDVILTSSINEEANKFIIASSELNNNNLESHVFYYKSVTFDVNIGFIFKRVHWIPPTRYCYPNAGKNLDEEIIVFNTSLTIFKVNEPIIRSKTHGNVHEGNDFQLICEVYMPSQLNESDFHLSWHMTPTIDHVNQDQRSLEYQNTFIKHSNSSCNIVLSKLSIKNAQKTDANPYFCHFTADRYAERHRVANYTMKILARNETYLHLRKLVQYIPKRNLRSKTIQVEHSGYPLPTLIWYDPKGNEIWKYQNRLSVQFMDHLTSLTLTYPHSTDNGNYTLRATNGKETKEIVFYIRVRGFLSRSRYNSETGTMEKIETHF